MQRWNARERPDGAVGELSPAPRSRPSARRANLALVLGNRELELLIRLMAAVSASPSPPHIFVCFSSKDEAVARNVVQYLEAQGLTCWISLRDVPPGQNYQETIVEAVESAKGLVFLFSENSSRSGETKKELSLAGAANVPVFPLRLAPIVPTGALRYELATRQWIDLFDDPKRALGKLTDTINRTLSQAARDAVHGDQPAGSGGGGIKSAADASPPPSPARAPTKKRSAKQRAPLIASDSEEFEAVRSLLARHIGPIAKLFVQKAATEAENLEAFCERLAAHVPSPADRASFLQAVRARLAAGR
jgi:hypothetical protein